MAGELKPLVEHFFIPNEYRIQEIPELAVLA